MRIKHSIQSGFCQLIALVVVWVDCECVSWLWMHENLFPSRIEANMRILKWNEEVWRMTRNFEWRHFCLVSVFVKIYLYTIKFGAKYKLQFCDTPVSWLQHDTTCCKCSKILGIYWIDIFSKILENLMQYFFNKWGPWSRTLIVTFCLAR